MGLTGFNRLRREQLLKKQKEEKKELDKSIKQIQKVKKADAK
ncbi:hypothetical protein [Brevibacillus brevis]|nr:hypothetical protein [Brevibacillus brevis]RED28438.1 hypothetical protein DES34_108305 [Brevibacillus brevis]GEC90692.1 hypothetical protein BBR01nite_30230 [Brevibacillus brevis]VEF91133.1 Uncharacterised protein [Brevibacillus brevis]